jgi:hypothetical protein
MADFPSVGPCSYQTVRDQLMVGILTCFNCRAEELATRFASGLGKLMAHQCLNITLFPNCDIHVSANSKNKVRSLSMYNIVAKYNLRSSHLAAPTWPIHVEEVWE